MCINQKSKYEEIQRLIEDKYPDVDYSSLKERVEIAIKVKHLVC